MSSLEVDTVVICDDIRQEANGKYLLIGVYGGNILLRGFPVDLRLALWMLVKPPKLGPLEARIRLVGPLDTTLVEGQMAVTVREPGLAIIALEGLPVQLQREGKIKVEVASHAPNGKDDWKVVKVLDVMLAPPKTARAAAG